MQADGPGRVRVWVRVRVTVRVKVRVRVRVTFRVRGRVRVRVRVREIMIIAHHSGVAHVRRAPPSTLSVAHYQPPGLGFVGVFGLGLKG